MNTTQNNTRTMTTAELNKACSRMGITAPTAKALKAFHPTKAIAASMFIDNLEYNPPVESLADARSAWFQLFKAQEAVLLSRRIGTDNGDRIANLLANLTTAEAASNKASDHLCRLIAASIAR
jgi:hypothetical protein